MPHESRPAPPNIHVQIVHIEGPRKGQIDEFDQTEITIGRLPTSDVAFPQGLRIVSRKHAEIKREGNRFLLINHGANGCYVNGQPADSAYLKQGDVVTFAEGGPKVSFLYSVKAPAGPLAATPIRKPAPPPPPAPPRNATPRPAKPTAATASATGPFTIQYGITIKSLEQHSVILGTDVACDFVVDHPRVFGRHAELFFHEGQYYLRDLTDSQATLLNGSAVHTATPLQTGDRIGFGDGGPSMKCLGAGRFVEVIE